MPLDAVRPPVAEPRRARPIRGLAHMAAANLIRLGRVNEGLALLDEGMAAAATERLSAPVLGLVYCRTIGACLDLFRRRPPAKGNALTNR